MVLHVLMTQLVRRPVSHLAVDPQTSLSQWYDTPLTLPSYLTCGKGKVDHTPSGALVGCSSPLP